MVLAHCDREVKFFRLNDLKVLFKRRELNVRALAWGRLAFGGRFPWRHALFTRQSPCWVWQTHGLEVHTHATQRNQHQALFQIIPYVWNKKVDVIWIKTKFHIYNKYIFDKEVGSCSQLLIWPKSDATKKWANAGAKLMKEVQCTRWEFGILCEA